LIVFTLLLLFLASHGLGFAEEPSAETSMAQVAIEYRLKADEVRQTGADQTEMVAAYIVAADKLSEYLDKFPTSDDHYQMQFYYADTLYKAEKFRESAGQFKDLLRTEDSHEFGDQSMFLHFWAWERVLNAEYGGTDILLDSAQTERIYLGPTGKTEVTVYKLSEAHEEFITAADMALAREWKDPKEEGGTEFGAAMDDARPKVMYLTAQILFYHNRYEEARPRLLNLINRFRQTDEASYAASLLIDTYQKEGDWANVRAYTQEFITYPVGDGPGGFSNVLEGSTFKIAYEMTEDAMALEAEGKHEEASLHREGVAEAFLRFIEEFGEESEYSKAALYNAAFNYQIAGKAERANELFEAYLNKYPNDELSKPLYFQIAANYESTFELEKAVGYYELLAKEFPYGVDSGNALYNAAFLKNGLGDHLGAAETFERYATQAPFSESEDRESVHFKAGEQYELVDAESALRFYRNYLDSYGIENPSHALEAQYKIAQFYKGQNKRQYEREVDKIIEIFDDVIVAGKEPGAVGRHYAAESAFRDVEEAYQDVVDDPLTKDEAKDAVLLNETKPEELLHFEDLAMNFTKKYKDFEYSTLALYYRGMTYLYLADLGLDLEPTPKFYRFEEKGIHLLVELIDAARAQKKHPPSITRAQNALNERDPRMYPVEKLEIRGGVKIAVIDALREQNRFDEAIDEAKAALKVSANDMDAYINMGLVYMDQGKYDLATFVFQKALVSIPVAANNAPLYCNLGWIQYLKGDEYNALLNMKRATELDDRLLPALVYQAHMYLDDRNYEDMVPLLERAKEQSPGNYGVLMNLGIAYRGVGRFAEAEDAFKRALKLEPKNPDPYFNLGILYGDFAIDDQGAKRYDDAIKAYESYIKRGGSKKDLVAEYIEKVKEDQVQNSK
jgi:tetratricopeptide (TPR) repeat protein/TolA-binding protein